MIAIDRAICYSETYQASNTATTEQGLPTLDYTRDAQMQRALEQWQTAIREDYCSGKPIQEWRVFQQFGELTPEKQEKICRYLLDNYNIELQIPSNKIVLSTPKDDLEDDLSNWPLPQKGSERFTHFSANHFLVLLFSARGIKKNPVQMTGSTGPVSNGFSQFAISQASPDPGNYKPDGETITLGEGSDQVKFILPKEGADQAKIQELYEMVKRINVLLPDEKKVRVVEVYLKPQDNNEEEGKYVNADNCLKIGINRQGLRNVSTHEMGHALFKHLFAVSPTSNISENKTLVYLYCLSLYSDNSQIIDDSNYVPKVSKKVGHPRDNMSEMFASAVDAYLEGRDEFIAILNDPDTPEGMRSFGRLMYAFLRDKVFADKVEQTDDPLVGASLADLEGGVTDEAIVQLVLGLSDNKDQYTALAAALRAGINDPRLYQLLDQWLADPRNKGLAMIVIGEAQLADEKYVQILLDAVDSKDFGERTTAINALGISGSKDPRVRMKILTVAQNDSDTFVKMAAKQALKILDLQQ
ncbi:MAG: HEAT repeat domain-containing protein [Candidatus Saganbacteria bacterium]|nr:HEAT repeat domain-containing protein [Candidatus Saganbacteria bacterium]